MPLIKDDPDMGVPYMPGDQNQAPWKQPEEVSWGEGTGAYFRQENMIGSLYQGGIETLVPHAAFEPDQDFDASEWLDENDLGDDYERYTGVRSRKEAEWRRGQLKREDRDRDSIARMGWAGLPVGFAMGVLDPTVLIPGVGALKTAKGTYGAVKSAAAVAGSAGVAVAAQELGLQATQQTRTAGESAMNITAGMVLGGLIGGGTAGLLNKADLEKKFTAAAEKISKDDDAVYEGFQNSSAGAAQAEILKNRLIGEKTIKATKLDKLTTVPVLKAMTSKFNSLREAQLRLDPGGLATVDNKAGKTAAVGGHVMARSKVYEGYLYKAVSAYSEEFSKYFHGGKTKVFASRARATAARAMGNKKMSEAQFSREVTKALRHNDVHSIPEVAAAAQRIRATVFEPMKKQLVDLGRLGEDAKVMGSDSYLTRIFKVKDIISEQTRFKKILRDNYLAKHPDADPTVVEMEVDNTYTKITSSKDYRMTGAEVYQDTARGSLKGRVLDIEDDLIEDFLEDDIETILNVYTRQVGTDIELIKMFGDEKMTKVFDDIDAEAANIAAKIEKTNPKSDNKAALKELGKETEAAKRLIEAQRDRARGLYGLPDNPDAMPNQLLRFALNMNYLRLLGGMTISAVPDIAKLMQEHGMWRTMSAGVNMAYNWKKFRMSTEEVKSAGTALDLVLDTRMKALADMYRDWQAHGGAVDKVMQAGTRNFGVVSLMAPWNAALKQMSGVMTIDKIVRASRAWRDGKIDPSDMTRLAQSGINEDMAKRIAKMVDENDGGGEFGNLWLTNTDNWKDAEAVRAFKAAIVEEVDRTVVTPGLEKPLWMSRSVGKFFGQFRSFGFSSVTRTTMAGLQRHDLKFFSGMIMATALGAGVSGAKMWVADRSTESWSGGKWMAEGVDRSGMWAIFSDVNNIAERLSGNRIGLAALTGEAASRYQSRNRVGALLGPSMDMIKDGVDIVSEAIQGEWTAGTTRKVRKMIPFQNIFYLRKLFNQVESGVNEFFGIPERKNSV